MKGTEALATLANVGISVERWKGLEGRRAVRRADKRRWRLILGQWPLRSTWV